MSSHLVKYTSELRTATDRETQVLEEHSSGDLSWKWTFTTNPSKKSTDDVFLNWVFKWDKSQVSAYDGKISMHYKRDNQWIDNEFSVLLKRSGQSIRRKLGSFEETTSREHGLDVELIFQFEFTKIPAETRRDSESDDPELVFRTESIPLRAKSARVTKRPGSLHQENPAAKKAPKDAKQPAQRSKSKSRSKKSGSADSAATSSDELEAEKGLPVYRHAFRVPEIRLDSRFFGYYATTDVDERIQLLKESAVVVKRHSEMTLFRDMLREFRIRWTLDKNIFSVWDNVIAYGTHPCFRYLRILGERVEKRFEWEVPRDDARDDAFIVPDWVNQFVEKGRYTAPRNRILIHPNITLNEKNIVPVYSDIPGETLENLSVPSTLTYEYGDTVRINVTDEPNLKAILEEAEEEQNQIRCDCHDPSKSSKNLISCYDNPNCPCFLTNKALQSLQTRKDETTTFESLKQIVFNSANNPFFDFVGFACSEGCGCRGNCTNNSLYLVDNKKFPFELYRTNNVVGFGLRSPVAIPAGTPFLEFTGELQTESNLPHESIDYAYHLNWVDDEKFHKFVMEHKKWTPKYAKLLRKAHQVEHYVNPKYYGNAARTALHSCLSNTEIFRIYQKSLSPAHAKMVLVSMDDIMPGTPITIDYGVTYVKTQMKNNCQCGTFACGNNPYGKELQKMSRAQISLCLTHINGKRFCEYVEMIVKKAGDVERNTLIFNKVQADIKRTGLPGC